MATDYLNWFKVMCIYSLQPNLDNSEELSEIDKIQLTNKGIIFDFATDYCYLNLSEDTVIRAEPRCFIPKEGGERKNRKYFTEVVMKSGDVFYAVGKPEDFYDKLNEYILSLPENKEK